MRFAFTLFDHRVSLSISRYAAPAITFEDNLPRASIIPFGSVYPESGDALLVQVNEGANFLWTKGANDGSIVNADTKFPISDTGTIRAAAFLVKATATSAENVAWGASLPDTIASLDGITLNVNDTFLIQGRELSGGDNSQNDVYSIRDVDGHYDEWHAPFFPETNGFTAHVLQGTAAGRNYYTTHLLGEGSGNKPWVLGTAGKVYLRLYGTPGTPVTALLQPIP